MSQRNWLSTMMLAVLLLALVGCTPPPAAPAPAPTSAPASNAEPAAGSPPGQGLPGSEWQLDAMFGGPAAVPVVPGSVPTLAFAENRYLGFGGCNWYQGLFVLRGTNGLQFNGPATTRFGCTANTPTSVQEATLIPMLTSIAKYDIKDGKLRMFMGDDTLLLTFTQLQPVPLEGTPWLLNFYFSQPTAMWTPPLVGTMPTLRFEGGQVSGNTGCNDFTGKYDLQGDQLKISNLATTKKTCDQPNGIMTQEQAYLSTLQSATTLQKFPRTVQLLGSDGQPLLIYNTGK